MHVTDLVDAEATAVAALGDDHLAVARLALRWRFAADLLALQHRFSGEAA